MCSLWQLALKSSKQATSMTQETLLCHYVPSLNKVYFQFLSTVCISAGAFVICWTPGLVTLLLDGLLGKESHANRYEKYCLFIAECNSLVNPIIYSLRDDEMRTTFKWILCSLCRRGVHQQRQLSLVKRGTSLREVPSLIRVLTRWCRIQLVKCKP